MSEVLQYRKARTQYAIEMLKNEMNIFAKSIEQRISGAKNKSDLNEALDLIEILENTNRFYREIANKKPHLPKAKELFNYKLNV